VRAAVVREPGIVVVEDVADPSPTGDEVVVAVSLCGICGTDLHVVDGDYPAVKYPVIPGHEFSGTVVAVGSNVVHLAPGAEVAVDPMIFCGCCVQCRRGATNLCLRGGGLGTTANGALAEFVAVKASQCEALPPELPPGWAPMIEPLSCVVHAMDRIGPVLGDRTLVIGSGAAGLLMVGTLALAGAAVTVLESIPERRSLAPAFGALETTGDLSDLGDGTNGWDLVVDASGSAGAISLGLANLNRGARLCIFGVASPQARVEISPFDVFSRELTIIGTTSVRNSFRRAADLMTTGTLPIDLLVGEPLPLERTLEALERTRHSQGIKTRVAPGTDISALRRRVA
jgi:2-desacetyl-2-hydroxyethyl bacteriochlorophyllide A dehydrogenase